MSSEAILMLIQKVISLHSTKCMYKRISLVMLKLLTILVILRDKSTRSKALSKKLRNNGKVSMLVYNLTRKHINSKELMLSLPFYKNIWVFYQTKKLVCFTKISRIKSNCGKITYKEFLKLYKC